MELLILKLGYFTLLRMQLVVVRPGKSSAGRGGRALFAVTMPLFPTAVFSPRHLCEAMDKRCPTAARISEKAPRQRQHSQWRHRVLHTPFVYLDGKDFGAGFVPSYVFVQHLAQILCYCNTHNE